MEHLKFVFFILTAIFIASCSNNDEPDAPDKTPDASEEINLLESGPVTIILCRSIIRVFIPLTSLISLLIVEILY